MQNPSGPDAQWKGRDIPAGTPMFDRNGHKVGEVSSKGWQGDQLVMHKGHLFARDVYIPGEVVQRVDESGVHLKLTHEEVSDIARGSWSNLDDRDLITGVPAETDLGFVPNFPDGNNVVGTRTAIDVPTGLPHDDELTPQPDTTETASSAPATPMMPEGPSPAFMPETAPLMGEPPDATTTDERQTHVDTDTE